LVTAFLKKSKKDPLDDTVSVDLLNCCGGGCTGGGETIFLGESETGRWEGFGVEGGVMNTVYGPIFPIIGGGEESRLIAIEGRRQKLRERRERAKSQAGEWEEKEQRPKSKDTERERDRDRHATRVV
jgi:hypothetical protein